MEDKTLKNKAIKIKGKDYVQVKDRVTYFNDTYPNGSIETSVESDNGKEIIFCAIVTPDVSNPDRYFTGFAGGIRGGSGVDSTSAVENAETSAIGRALAMMGIGIIDSVASADEMHKAGIYHPGDSEAPRGITAPQNSDLEPATHEQMKYIKTLIMRNFDIRKDDKLEPLEKELGYKINGINKKMASELIGQLKDIEWVNGMCQRLIQPLD